MYVYMYIQMQVSIIINFKWHIDAFMTIEICNTLCMNKIGTNLLSQIDNVYWLE